MVGLETEMSQLGAKYSKFLREMDKKGGLRLDPSLNGSMDFTYTRQTTTRWKTNAPREGKFKIKSFIFPTFFEN